MEKSWKVIVEKEWSPWTSLLIHIICHILYEVGTSATNIVADASLLHVSKKHANMFVKLNLCFALLFCGYAFHVIYFSQGDMVCFSLFVCYLVGLFATWTIKTFQLCKMSMLCFFAIFPLQSAYFAATTATTILLFYDLTIIGGNDFRLSEKRSHYDLRNFSFINRTVHIWNSLPNVVIDVDSVDLFKSRLDNFWIFQDVKYDYTVNLALPPLR